MRKSCCWPACSTLHAILFTAGSGSPAFEILSVIVKCFGCRGVGGADLAGVDHLHGVIPGDPTARSAESENGPRHGAAQIARP